MDTLYKIMGGVLSETVPGRLVTVLVGGVMFFCPCFCARARGAVREPAPRANVITVQPTEQEQHNLATCQTLEHRVTYLKNSRASQFLFRIEGDTLRVDAAERGLIAKTQSLGTVWKFLESISDEGIYESYIHSTGGPVEQHSTTFMLNPPEMATSVGTSTHIQESESDMYTNLIVRQGHSASLLVLKVEQLVMLEDALSRELATLGGEMTQADFATKVAKVERGIGVHNNLRANCSDELEMYFQVKDHLIRFNDGKVSQPEMNQLRDILPGQADLFSSQDILQEAEATSNDLFGCQVGTSRSSITDQVIGNFRLNSYRDTGFNPSAITVPKGDTTPEKPAMINRPEADQNKKDLKTGPMKYAQSYAPPSSLAKKLEF